MGCMSYKNPITSAEALLAKLLHSTKLGAGGTFLTTHREQNTMDTLFYFLGAP